MWVHKFKWEHEISIVRRKGDATGGDLLFLISCHEIISATDRNKYRKTLVIHASDLPYGRGWSPHIWQLVQGATEITLSLLEAEDLVDSGAIWMKEKLVIPKSALWNEINQIIFDGELTLMTFAVKNFNVVKSVPQSNDVEATYFSKRTPAMSEIDPKKSIVEQFDLIRVCDPVRYPATFHYLGRKYKIKLEESL
jgi:methionyl-tRNA formyltransferase